MGDDSDYATYPCHAFSPSRHRSEARCRSTGSRAWREPGCLHGCRPRQTARRGRSAGGHTRMPAIVTANNAMRRVPKTFDGGDIDDHGHWRSEERRVGKEEETEVLTYGDTSNNTHVRDESLI